MIPATALIANVRWHFDVLYSDRDVEGLMELAFNTETLFSMSNMLVIGPSSEVALSRRMLIDLAGSISEIGVKIRSNSPGLPIAVTDAKAALKILSGYAARIDIHTLPQCEGDYTDHVLIPPKSIALRRASAVSS